MDWKTYSSDIKKALYFDYDTRIIESLKKAKKDNNTVFIAGNGGSAAIAEHYSIDFLKQGLRTICLSSNSSKITAIANDLGYNEVFKQQLVNSYPGDILICISSSGNSPNIIKAIKYARSRSVITIGICGFDGGKLKKLVHHSVHIFNKNYGICEDIHSIFGHFLAEQLKEK